MKKVRLLESIQPQEKEHTDYPSRYEIGERVTFSFNKVEIPAVVRCAIFTMGKIRYTLLLLGDAQLEETTSIHNVDSVFVKDYVDAEGKKVVWDLDFDNYS